MTEWTERYIKNRDLLNKNIEYINRDKEGLVVRYKDRKEFFIICTFLESFAILKEKLKRFELEKESINIVFFNNKKNLGIIIDNWQELIKFRNLKIYFVNPFSDLDKKWIVQPFTHHRICDEGSLAKGLRSMFETVEELNKENVGNLLNDSNQHLTNKACK